MKLALSRMHFACFLFAGAVALATGCGSSTPTPVPPVPVVCTPGCNGQVLTSCDSSAVATTKDCSAQKDAKGNAMTCDYLKDQQAFDCIGDYSGGCGDETMNGRCDGTKLIYCLSADSGNAAAYGETPVNVVNLDCAQDTTGLTACAVAPDGVANCVKPGTMGCGGIPSDGICDGNTLTQCVNSAVVTTDCAASAGKCGLADVGSGYACINASFYKTTAGNATNLVSGTFVYEKLTVDTTSIDTASNGFLPTPVLTPVRRALVQLLVAADDTEIQRTFTDETGAFTLYLTSLTVPAYVQVSASGDPTREPLVVRDCPQSNKRTYPAGCTDKVGNAYQLKTATFTGAKALGQTTLTEASGLGGAFNIFNLALKGQEFARVNLNGGNYPSTPALVAQWKRGYETTTSYYSSATRAITIQGSGGGTDTDEFDDPVIMHEFGHFLQANFSISDSPGGAHDGSPTDPRLGFGEGYGTYVGCRIAGSSLYFDTQGSGAGVTDINNTGLMASATDPLGIKQLMSETVVSEIMWRLDLGTGGNTTGVGATNGLGSAPVFDVLGKYLKNNTKFNNTHGVTGRELVKFLDGWFCRDYQTKGTSSTAILQKVVTTDHGFPYDDFSHTIAPIGSCP